MPGNSLFGSGGLVRIRQDPLRPSWAQTLPLAAAGQQLPDGTFVVMVVTGKTVNPRNSSESNRRTKLE